VRLLAVAAITFVLLVVGAMVTFGLVSGSTRSAPEPATAPLALDPTPTYTLTPAPTATSTLSPTATPTPVPSPSPAPSPSPFAAGSPVPPTRVTGRPVLTMVFRDTEADTVEVEDPSTHSVTYLEGTYLWGEVVTQIGNAYFGPNRDSTDGNDQAQDLPPYLRLNMEFSGALINAIRVQDRGKEDFRPETGEFWVGQFRCGSALPAESSPYSITVELLQDGQEIAKERYVIGVRTNPNCREGPPDDSGPPRDRG
jgi:hypothetical protein